MGRWFTKGNDSEVNTKPKERYNPMKEMKEQNDMIYQYYLEHDISYKELAEKFNRSLSCVRTLVCRRGGKKR